MVKFVQKILNAITTPSDQILIHYVVYAVEIILKALTSHAVVKFLINFPHLLITDGSPAPLRCL